MKKTLYLLLTVAVTMITLSCKKEDPKEPNKDPKEYVVEISTDFGNMYIWLHKETPKHRDNFLKLSREKFFDSTTFHRIIPGFVIQGGDPNSKDNDPGNDGNGGPGYTIPAEFVDSLKHIRGAVAAARLGDNVNPQRESSGSQFYIVMDENNTKHLNGAYTVFGYVMKGMNVADSIVNQPKSPGNNRPLTDIRMYVKVLEKTKKEIKAEYNFDLP